MENPQKMEKENKRLNRLVCQQEMEYHQLLKTSQRLEKIIEEKDKEILDLQIQVKQYEKRFKV